MRHGRAKASRKTLQYFQRTTGLKPPFSILVDATFVTAMFQQKILPFTQRLDKVLQGPSTPPNKYYIVGSAVDELRQIYEGLDARNHAKAPAFSSALEWIRKECTILAGTKTKEGSPPQERNLSTKTQQDLLRNLETSEVPYVVASQDEELLIILRQMGTVPIVRLANHTVLILENPSKASQLQAKGEEREKWRHNLPTAEKALVDFVQRENNADKKTNTPHNRPRVKKAKGPNPLSCKRKQTPDDSKKEESSNSKKRRRRT